MDFIYYIQENVITTNKQGLKKGTMITKSNIDLPIPENIDGVYKSLDELKEKSSIFKKLKKENPKRANKIIEERHIFNGTKILKIPKGQILKQHQIDLLIHSTTGRVLNGNVTGVHFYDSDKVRLLNILNINEKTKVFEAEFEFYQHKTKKWIRKKGTSTFFPKEWSIDRLLQELIFAEKNAIRNSEETNTLSSQTDSGIRVKIIKKKGNVKTIFPLI